MNLRKQTRKDQADARNAAYRALTLQEKIARLPVSGAKKQRAKLMKLAERT